MAITSPTTATRSPRGTSTRRPPATRRRPPHGSRNALGHSLCMSARPESSLETTAAGW